MNRQCNLVIHKSTESFCTYTETKIFCLHIKNDSNPTAVVKSSRIAHYGSPIIAKPELLLHILKSYFDEENIFFGRVSGSTRVESVQKFYRRYVFSESYPKHSFRAMIVVVVCGNSETSSSSSSSSNDRGWSFIYESFDFCARFLLRV